MQEQLRIFIYEAADTTTNLNIVLGPLKAQISSLCGKTVWKLVYSHVPHYAACNKNNMRHHIHQEQGSLGVPVW